MADLITRPEPVEQISPTAVRWTRDDCEALERAGVLNFRYELVEGVINRMGQKLRHAGIIRRLLFWLCAIFGEQFVVSQATIDVRPDDNPTSEPEPDLIVMSRRDVDITGNPGPEDLRLLVEVSDTTLSYDLTTKAGLYARAGIVEYWVLNVCDRKLHVHRQPDGGAYFAITTHSETESVAPLVAPDKAVQVSTLLPPAAAGVERP